MCYTVIVPRKGRGSKRNKTALKVKSGFADTRTAIAHIGRKDIATLENAFYGAIASLGYEGFLYFDENTAIPNPQALLIHKDPQVTYANLFQLFRKIKADGLIGSLAQVRTNAVVGLDWDIIPAGKGSRDIEIADFCKANLKAHFNLTDLIEYIVGGAIDFGFSVTEQVPFVWEEAPFRGNMGVKLHRRPQGWFVFDGDENLRFLSKTSGPEGIKVPAKRFIVGQYKAEPLNPYGNGLLGVSFWTWLAKKYGQKWRLIFLERYGIPSMIGQYENESDKSALYTALLAAIQDVVMVIPKGSELDFPDIDRKSTHDVFQSHLNYEDDTLRYIWLGQTLSTKEGEYGTRAQAEVHERVREDLTEYDVKSLLVAPMNGQYIRPLVDLNYPRESFTDYPNFVVDYRKDVDERGQGLRYVVEGLLLAEREFGILMTDEYKYERLGIPMPDEDTLKEWKAEQEAKKPKFAPPSSEEAAKLELEGSSEEEKKEFAEPKKKASVFATAR